MRYTINWVMKMKIVKTIFEILLLSFIFIITIFGFIVVHEYNKNSVYLNDFKYQKTRYYENKIINKKIDELVKNNTLVSNNVFNKRYVCLLENNNGNYASYIYGYYNGKLLEIKDLFKNEDGYELFKSKVEEMLALKYPKFVKEELINNSTPAYDILENKIIIHYNKTELLKEINEDLYVEINYVELIIDNNNILNYSFQLDSNYENPNTYKLDPNKKTIAFTFDDGPAGEKTMRIMNALLDNKANATFFILGNKVNNYKETVEFMNKNGFEIGSHTYEHTSLPKLKNGKLEESISKTENNIKAITGKDVLLIRPPYGAINDYVKESLNHPFILWDVDTNDWLYKDKDHNINHIIENAKDGDIVLMHDIHEPTVETVEEVLPMLYLKGYQVVSVSELAELKGYKLENHHAYRSFK